MHHLYPVLFGELARMCQQLKPSKVRVIWWSDDVESEQVFTERDYANLPALIKPKGMGGTTVSNVARYVREKRYKFQASVYLTDGYVESQYEVVPGPVLWGILDNESFRPIRGQVLRIYSDAL
jgi:predicted metal-dependent peptidase